MTPVERMVTEEAKTATDPTIPIAEIFGPTLQGEGALAGRPTYFLRVGGCDYACVWCDSDHAVVPEKVRDLERLTQAQITGRLFAWVDKHPGPNWLTISGGNPALYDLGEVVERWHWVMQDRDGKVAVETQGSRWQNWLYEVDLLTISPKPPSSEMPRGSDSWAPSREMLSKFMAKLGNADLGGSKRVCLKVVVFDEADYEFARKVHRDYPLVPFYLSTGTAMGGLSGRWVPPAIPDLKLDGYDVDKFAFRRRSPETNWGPIGYADTRDSLLRRYRWLAEKAAADPDMADVAIFPQLHVLLWGHVRGV